MDFPEGGELIPVGVVSHITEQLVIIQGYPDTPPVDEGTVLWSEGKKSLSMVSTLGQLYMTVSQRVTLLCAD